VIPFQFNKFAIGSIQLGQIKRLMINGSTRLRVTGYASSTSGQDDIRISLDRALQVKSALVKMFPGASFTTQGSGTTKNALCAQYNNQCVVVSVLKK
jgi:outer membrane protein OmpA-like peptidoglycan-associated protein